eukprot:279480_1
MMSILIIFVVLYAHGINSISMNIYDMSKEDYEAKILMHLDPIPMLEATRSRKAYQPMEGSYGAVPDAFDWRDHGAVTPVKNQEACGTCWAFSTTGNLEGQWFLHNNNSSAAITALSEEFLSDCDANDCGMFGGWPYLAMQYIISRGGIPSEEDYPYCCDCDTYGPDCFPCMASNYNKTMCGNHDDLYCNTTWNTAHCPATDWQPTAVIKDWMAISQDEKEIAIALYNIGPLSALMNAETLQRYKGGVFDPKACDPSDLDHGVLIVGYGDEDGTPFWIVKNSWGAKWGEDGYFRIVRGSGKCGINTAIVTGCVDKCQTNQTF